MFVMSHGQVVGFLPSTCCVTNLLASLADAVLAFSNGGGEFFIDLSVTIVVDAVTGQLDGFEICLATVVWIGPAGRAATNFLGTLAGAILIVCIGSDDLFINLPVAIVIESVADFSHDVCIVAAGEILAIRMTDNGAALA